MPNHDNDKSEDSLVSFRLSRLEESFAILTTNLNTLKELFFKWDAKINENGWPLQCSLHNERMTNIHKRLDEQDAKVENMNKEIQEIKSVIWKAGGALIVLSIVVQLAGPMVMEKVFGHTPQPTIEFVQPK